MKKIPTLFVRTFDEYHNKGITEAVTPGMEWVLNGEGIATVKLDGSCCYINNGVFYKRYDAKQGKQPPADAVPCCEPDPITGHWPHWMPVKAEEPGDRWHYDAYLNSDGSTLTDGTYEVIGPHFRANPYNLEKDILVKHGVMVLDAPRTYEDLKLFLKELPIEGLVFWKDGIPQCKLKRSDFGFKWPTDGADTYFQSLYINL